MDAFYVQKNGAKMPDGKEALALRNALLRVLDDDAGAPAAPKGRPKLQRARASVAR